MGVVGSLPSPPPSSSSTPVVSTEMFKEEPIPMNDECSYKIVKMDAIDFHRDYSDQATIEENQSENRSRTKRADSTMAAYGPLTVAVRKAQPPTLATGRRSKFLILEGEEAIRRELRRKRNRDAAKKLKEKRFIMEQQLQKDIADLESKEQELTSKVKNLENYKEQLELRYQHILYMQEQLSKSISSTTKSIKYHPRTSNSNVSFHRIDSQIKEEPQPPSPQWQLLFSI